MAQTKVADNVVSINANIDPNAPTGPVLKMVDGQPMVSSQEVASHFGKRHADLLRSIQAIVRNSPEGFGERNFAFSEYTDTTGRKLPAYLLTRDGFVIVAMGFTGPKAIKWKIAYIQAFNAMEAEISGHPAQTPALPSADLSRLTTVDDRRPLKALVDAWVAASKANGKFLAHTEAFRIARTPVGGRKMKELTLADIPVAMAYVQEQLERELAAASPMVTAITAAESPAETPPALPPLRRRESLDDYRDLYKLPDSPTYWDPLRTKLFQANEALAKVIEEIKAEATKPFRVGRKHEVATYFDSAIAPIFSLFEEAEQTQWLTYRNVYNALEGCQGVWRLLRIG